MTWDTTKTAKARMLQSRMPLVADVLLMPMKDDVGTGLRNPGPITPK